MNATNDEAKTINCTMLRCWYMEKIVEIVQAISKRIKNNVIGFFFARSSLRFFTKIGKSKKAKIPMMYGILTSICTGKKGRIVRTKRVAI